MSTTMSKQDAMDRLEILTTEKERLETLLEARKAKIKELHTVIATGSENQNSMEDQIEGLEEDAGRLEADIEAQKVTIGGLREKLADYQKADKQWLAERDSKAAEIRRDEEARDAEHARNQAELAEEEAVAQEKAEEGILRGKMAGIASIFAGIPIAIFTVLFFFGREMSWHLWVGVPALTWLVIFFANSLLDAVQAAIPHVKAHWRWFSIPICLFLGGTIATLGLPEMEEWLPILPWIITTLGYGGLLLILVEAAHWYATEGEDESASRKEIRRTLIFQAVMSVIAGICFIFLNPLDLSISNPMTILLYICLSVIAIGVLGIIGIALLWLSRKVLPKLIASFKSLLRKEIKKGMMRDTSLHWKLVLVAVVSVAVGCIVGSFFWSGEVTASAMIFPITLAVIFMFIFFAVESKPLLAANTRKKGWWKICIIPLLIATVSSPMTISTGYHGMTARQRFEDIKTDVIEAENAFMTAVKPVLKSQRQFVTTDEEVRKIDLVTANLDKVWLKTREAKTREELESAVGSFRHYGTPVANKMGKELRKLDLMGKVQVPQDPRPIVLIGTVFGSEVDGVQRVEWTAFWSSLILTLFVEYVAFILALATRIWYLFVRKEGEEEEVHGEVYGFDWNKNLCRVGANRILEAGGKFMCAIEKGDRLNVLWGGEEKLSETPWEPEPGKGLPGLEDESVATPKKSLVWTGGNTVSTLEVLEEDMPGSFLCKILSPNRKLTIGCKVAIVANDTEDNTSDQFSEPDPDVVDAAPAT